MTCEVAVYRFRDPDDRAEFEDGEPAPFAVISLNLDLVAIVGVEAETACSYDDSCRPLSFYGCGADRRPVKITLPDISSPLPATVRDVEAKDELPYDACEVAARAWIEAVGRHRQPLCIGRGAPKVVLKKRIDLDEIVSRIRLTRMPGETGDFYVLTYSFGWGAARAESWLIDTSPYWAREAATVAPDERSPQVQTTPMAGGATVLHPLWEPQLN